MWAVSLASAIEMQDVPAPRHLHELFQRCLAVPVRSGQIDDELPAKYLDLAQRNRDMAQRERGLNRPLALTVLEPRPAHIFDHVKTELAVRRNEAVEFAGLDHPLAAATGPVLEARMERADMEGCHRASCGLVWLQLAATGARDRPRLKVEHRGDGKQIAGGTGLDLLLDRPLEFLDQEGGTVFFPANAVST